MGTRLGLSLPPHVIRPLHHGRVVILRVRPPNYSRLTMTAAAAMQEVKLLKQEDAAFQLPVGSNAVGGMLM